MLDANQTWCRSHVKSNSDPFFYHFDVTSSVCVCVCKHEWDFMTGWPILKGLLVSRTYVFFLVFCFLQLIVFYNITIEQL